MKTLKIESCSQCPHCEQTEGRQFYCALTEAWLNDTREIHKDCPLVELPSREKARRILQDVKTGYFTMDEALDRLGFKA